MAMRMHNFQKHWEMRWLGAKDYLMIVIILLLSLPVWLYFGNDNFLIFWDGWAPMIPLLQWHQLFNTVFLYQFGSGTYSPGFTSYLLTLFPYTVLGMVFGPMTAERLIYFLSFSLSGISMYFLIKDMTKVKGNEIPALVAAIYYMFNFYWISGVFEDLIIPTILTFLPLIFLIYRRYLRNISTFRDVFSHYLILTVLSLVLIPGIFFQQSIAIYTFLLLYTVSSALFIQNNQNKWKIYGFRIISFFIFIFVTFVTYAYFLWPILLYSNVIGSFSGASSFCMSYLYDLTSRATLLNVIRDIQPSSFFYAPFSFGKSVVDLATSTSLPLVLATAVPSLFAILYPSLFMKHDRRESIALLLILVAVIFFQMGISGPFPSAYVWLGTHLPLGSVLLDPNITIGFLEPFLISILIGTGLADLMSRTWNGGGGVIEGIDPDGGARERLGRHIIGGKPGERSKKAVTAIVIVALVGTSMITAIPIFTGAFIPSYNSLGYSYYGPTISSKVTISPQIQKTFDNLRALIKGERVLVLPLQTGINMQSGNLSYVATTNVLQLETGADIISDNVYGFGPNSPYILSSINDLIYNTYYLYHGKWSMDQFFISTDNFSNTLSALGIQYVLLVPGIPQTPVNTYYPAVNYSMAKFFLDSQRNLQIVYSNDGYILYKNMEPITPVAHSVLSMNSSPPRVLVSNYKSAIKWEYYSASRQIKPLNFTNGFMFNYEPGAGTYFILPEGPLNISTGEFAFLNIVGRPINATVSFYYVYEYGENYTFKGNWGTSWFPMTSYPSFGGLSPSTRLQDVALSTQITYLPWLGKGYVPKIDWIMIAVTPESALKPGDRFGFEVKEMFFSNYSISLSALAYALSKGYSIVYIPYGAQVPKSLATKITIPAKVNVDKINEYKYIYNISGANGTFIINLPVTYSPYWDYSIIAGKNNVSSVSHIETDGFQNSYIIDAHGDFSIEIFFVPQNNLNIFAYISISCVIIELLYILYSLRSRKSP